MKITLILSLFLVTISLRAEQTDLLQLLSQMSSEGVSSSGVIQTNEQQLSSYIQLASAHDLQLSSYASTMKISQYRLKTSLPKKNPELRIGTSLDAPDEAVAALIRIYPKNPWISKANDQRNMARLSVDTAAYNQALLSTIAQITSLFKEVQCLEQEQVLVRRLIQIRQDFSDHVGKQVAASVQTQGQGLIARWKASDAFAEEQALAHKIGIAKQTIAALTGLKISQISVPLMKVDETFRSMNAATLTRIALESRPEMQAVMGERDLAQATLNATKAVKVPWFDFVEVGYKTRDNTWNVETGITLPFFSFRGSEAIFANEKLTQSQFNIETQEQIIRSEISGATRAYNLSVKEWDSLLKRQQPLIQKTSDYLDRMRKEYSYEKEQLELEEYLIDASLKIVTFRRKINQAQIDLILLLGQQEPSSDTP